MTFCDFLCVRSRQVWNSIYAARTVSEAANIAAQKIRRGTRNVHHCASGAAKWMPNGVFDNARHIDRNAG
jgi:hypothetical protein